MQVISIRLTIAALSAPLLFATWQDPEPTSRADSQDPWYRDLPDASDLVSGSLESNFPDSNLREDGTLPPEPGSEGGSPGGGGQGTGPNARGRGDAAEGAGGGRGALVAASESEPNNDFGGAQLTGPSARITGSIHPKGDYDWYGFDVERRGTLEVTFSKVPSPVHPSIRIHNGNGSAITGWIKTQLQGDGATTIPVHLKTKGRYYVAVADAAGDAQSTNSYELTLDFIAGDRFEPNESYGTRTMVSGKARLMGTILPQGDYDCYGFQVERRGSMEVRFPKVPKGINPSFRLHNAEGAAMTGWLRPTIRDDAAETMVVDLPKAGDYHIAVADADGDAFSEEPYTLYLTMHLGDRNESNETIGTATEVQATSKWSSSLLPMGDYDYYRFDVPVQGITTVQFSQVPSELLPSLRLHNAERSAITGWLKTSLRDGQSEAMVLDLAAPGRYFLSVANQDSKVRSFDPFQMSLKYDAGDAHEPNAGIGQATTITRGSNVSGSILPRGDYDHYRCEITHPGTLSVVFSRVPKSMTPSVRILNSNGSAMIGWTRPAIRDGAAEPVEVDIKQPGQYFIVIADKDSKAYGTDPYTFSVK